MSEHIKELDEGNFEQVVLQSEKPVLVDFWAKWCGPCRALGPVVEAIAAKYAGSAQVVKLNIDEHPGIVQRYHIQAVPTLIFFQHGEEKERIIGAASKDVIARAIEACVADGATALN